MAKYETTLFGQLGPFLEHLDRAILEGSLSASLEEAAGTRVGEAEVAVRVFERYSAFGGNRVSLSVTVVAWGPQLYVCAITSGGTDAVFLKILPVGEETFLEQAVAAIESFRDTGTPQR